MKPSNQGFVDLHNPIGFMVLGLTFLLFTVILLLGAFWVKRVARQEQLKREELKAKLKEMKGER